MIATALCKPVPPTGFQDRGRFNPVESVYQKLFGIYGEAKVFYSVTKTERNEDIRERSSAGYTIPELATLFNISNARVHQILHER